MNKDLENILMKKKSAFTLAEVLITLGIIGVVAAMTLPSLIKNHEQRVLKTQFLKAHSVLSQALLKTTADFGTVPACHIWEKRPYPAQKCIRWSADGKYCTGWAMADDGPYPPDWNGPSDDCTEFYKVFYKNLKVIKTCANTEREGCTAHYKGQDTILKGDNDTLTDQDLSDQTAGDSTLRETNFNRQASVVLADGLTIIGPNSMHPFLDINGRKGPNKWGYDLYRINRSGSPKKGLFIGSQSHPVEKGGKTWQAMHESCYKKK